MQSKLGSRGFATLAGAMVVTGPVLAACSVEPTYDDWAATDGAAGRINLDDVQDAFKKSDDASEFEQRVNKIYEGDGLVLIRVDQDGDRMTLDGFEDLDGNGEISESADDLLFSIVKDHDTHQMRGHGSNGYYRSSFGAGNFLFTYLLISSLSPGRYSYHTPSRNVGTIRSSRNSYRNSSGYRNQVSRNTNYANRQKRFAGSNYDRPASRARQTYQSTQRQSGAFKTSKTNVRGASRFGGGGRGGYRGGGGAQRIIGSQRSI